MGQQGDTFLLVITRYRLMSEEMLMYPLIITMVTKKSERTATCLQPVEPQLLSCVSVTISVIQ